MESQGKNGVAQALELEMKVFRERYFSAAKTARAGAFGYRIAVSGLLEEFGLERERL